MRPDLPPVIFKIAESSLGPNRFVPSYGILHQLYFEVASVTQGFSHNTLLDVTAANIALAEDLMISTDASATKSPARLSSCRADVIFSWSAASSNNFSMLEVQLVIAGCFPCVSFFITGCLVEACLAYQFPR